MTQKEFVQHIADTFKTCLDIVEKKNLDYAGRDTDPFTNFKESLKAGVPVERGMLVRTYDKLSRISTLLEHDAKVEDEAIKDTIDDAINYLAILKAYLASQDKE